MSRLPRITLAIEWDNARDVEPRWIARHLAALETEIARAGPQFTARPVVSYLYDPGSVDPREIQRQIDAYAPKLGDSAELELVPIEGADYFTLKSAGVARSRTEVVVIADCDTLAQPGWLTAIAAPFADTEVVAVAGFSSIQLDGFLSRVMALAWIFRLPSEAEAPGSRNAMHINNLAVRTAYFREHPLRAPRGQKKGGKDFLREVEASGKRWLRATDARLAHAPHASAAFFVGRGWRAGIAQDSIARRKVGAARVARTAHALRNFAQKAPRALARIFTKRREVGLPLWQTPAAFALVLMHWSATLAAQLTFSARR